MNREHSNVLACVGAVIGAGFASGREVVAFFTGFGWHGWWLILLAVLVMTALCALCMQAARTNGSDWTKSLRGGWLTELCPLMMMAITAGAMISAAGNIVALLWSHPQAYLLGAVGTLLAAWRMGSGELKALKLASAGLAFVLFCALLAALAKLPPQAVRLNALPGSIAVAAVRVVGYAAMNITLAIGVVCRCAEHTKNPWITAGWFGWIIGMLLLVSHCVYSRFPGAGRAPFPLIVLLAGYGRAGYLAGGTLLYLSILTTLISVLYALRTAVENRVARRDLRCLLVLGVPLAVSGVGFEGIVDRLYAPAGLLCLGVIFIPMALRARKRIKTTFP